MALFKLCWPLQFNIWSKPLWEEQRRACVIQRVVDSWLGMLPPEEEPAAKYTQRAGAACTLGGRGRRCACTLLGTSGAHAAEKFWRENQQRRSGGLSLNREGRVVAPDWTLYNVLSLYCLLPVLCQGGARSTITIAAAPILYAWYPQAGEADDIHRLLWWKRISLTNGVVHRGWILSLNQWEGRFTLEF